MKLFYKFILFLILTLSLNAITVEEVLTLARSRIGTEDQLKKVESIRFIGRINDGKGGGSPIELTMQKPSSQRLETVSAGYANTIATNGEEGYMMMSPLGESEEKPVIKLLNTDRVRKMRVNTIENLNFFQTKGLLRGNVEYKGLSIKRGKRCYKLLTTYPGGLSFMRFIDMKTGKLMTTLDYDEIEVVEEGEILVEGVLLPKTINAFQEGKIISSVTFERIILNPKLDKDYFDFPE